MLKGRKKKNTRSMAQVGKKRVLRELSNQSPGSLCVDELADRCECDTVEVEAIVENLEADGYLKMASKAEYTLVWVETRSKARV